MAKGGGVFDQYASRRRQKGHCEFSIAYSESLLALNSGCVFQAENTARPSFFLSMLSQSANNDSAQDDVCRDIASVAYVGV